jgi:ubiquinone/menaquinone biosynthesis C-methylase UbiE
MALNVQKFYDEHPINEGEILEKLAAEGIARDDIAPQDLTRFDQDHYGGTAATDTLADALGIAAGMDVLELCSGMGGTSRYLAYRHGATVLGVDLTASRVAGARRLTELVGLADRVRYQVGDVCRLDVGTESFDRIVSQESFLHLTDRESLFAGCHRALKPGGGIGFTDVVVAGALTPEARRTFADNFAAPALAGADDYVGLLTAAGFVDIQATDVSHPWRDILHDRLEMYRSLEAETVARFGRDRFDTYISTYAFFIDQIDAGSLGGGRFVAWKR